MGRARWWTKLRPRWPEALVYDPEPVGYVLREAVEVRSGRPISGSAAVEAAGRGPGRGARRGVSAALLVPMTLVNPGHLEEIFDALTDAEIAVHHFFLKVSEDVLVKRIDRRSFPSDDPAQDEQVRRWCKSRIESCMAAVDTLPRDTVLTARGARGDGRRRADRVGAVAGR